MTKLEGVARAMWAAKQSMYVHDTTTKWSSVHRKSWAYEETMLMAQAALDYLKQPTPASEPLLYGQGPELTIEQIKAMEKLP